jgi:hypothetical protein
MAASNWRINLARMLFGSKSVFIGWNSESMAGVQRVVMLERFGWNLDAQNPPLVSHVDFNYEVPADRKILCREISNRLGRLPGPSTSHGTEDLNIVYLKRSTCRALWTLDGIELGAALTEASKSKGWRFKVVELDGWGDIVEQMLTMLSTSIVIAVHGAALTNMIFCRPDTHIIEVSFRNTFGCDPVCDPHLKGEKPVAEQCTTNLKYHKADYRNLCKAFDLSYSELPAIATYESRYLNRNPISIDKLAVQLPEIMSMIEAIHRNGPI